MKIPPLFECSLDFQNMFVLNIWKSKPMFQEVFNNDIDKDLKYSLEAMSVKPEID